MKKLEDKTENIVIDKTNSDDYSPNKPNLIIRALPAGIALAGLVGWGIFANKGYAPTGIALFGISAICSIGLAEILGLDSYEDNNRKFYQ